MRRTVIGLAGGMVLIGAVTVLIVTSGSSDRDPGARGAAAMAQLQRLPGQSLTPAQRRESRLRYAAATPAEALALIRRSFPQYATGAAWPDLSKQPGTRVLKYLNANTARVRTDGQTAIVQSLLPLRATDRSGRLAPLDTTLERRGSRLAPKVTASRYSIPAGRLSESGSLASFPAAGFGLRTDIGSGVQRSLQRDGRLLVPSAGESRDVLLTPMPTGLQVAWQLRSIRASGDLSLRVPGADRLTVTRRAGMRLGAQIVRHGRRAGTIQAPMAVDAAGKAVKLRWSVAGDQLRITVDHRAPGVTMPVLVDPFVSDDQRYWNAFAQPSTQDFNGWTSSTQDVSNVTTWQTPPGPSVYGNGLYLARVANRPALSATRTGEWRFRARQVPGPFANEGGRIFKADFGFRGSAVSGTANACWTEGLRRSDGTTYENAVVRIGTPPNGNLLDPGNYVASPLLLCQNEGAAGNPLSLNYRVHCMTYCGLSGEGQGLGTAGNEVVLGIAARPGTSTGAFVYMGSSLIFQTETFGPKNQITGLPAPGGWIDDVPLTARADDYGMGMASLQATAVGAPATWAGSTAATPQCIAGNPGEVNPPTSTASGVTGAKNQGDRNHQCAQTMTTAFRSGGTSPMPEGSYNVRVRSTDIVQNSTQTDIPVKVDHNPPALNVTGPLSGADGGYARNGDTLNVTATDPHSGARTLSVKLDGQHIPGSPATCATDGCPTSLNYALNTNVVKEGSHILTIDASDLLGHAAPTRTINFKVDTTNPVVNLTGDLAAAEGSVITGARYTMRPIGQDIPGRQGLNSGTRKLTIRIDPDTAPADADHLFEFTNTGCSANTCPVVFDLTPEFEYDSSKYGNGTHVIRVTAEDAVGNTDVDSFSFSASHAARLPAQTLTADADTSVIAEGANPGDRLGVSVADIGDINEDGADDLLVGAPGTDVPGQTDAGAAYLIYGSENNAPVSLNGSDPRVVRFSWNQGGGNAGAAVAAGGDINGDGKLDLLIGAPGSSVGLGLPPVQGRVWAVFGSADLPAEVDLSALGSRGVQIKGPALSGSLIPPLLSSTATSTFGSQIAGHMMGTIEGDADVNGDGKDDIIVGAGNATSPALTGGVTYVIFGRSEAGTIDLGTSGDPGAAGFRVYGAKSVTDLLNPGQAGTSTAFIGDVNNDELADFVVTDPTTSATGKTGGGSAYIVFGKASSDAVGLANLNSGGYVIRGGIGDAVATATSPGDIDSDGNPDILLGGHGAFMVFSKADSDTVALDGEFDGYRMNAPSGAGFERASVSGVDDQDGDQAPDMIVGFPAADSNRGVGYLTYGKIDTAPMDLGALRGDQGTMLQGGAQTRSSAAAAAQATTSQTAGSAAVTSAPDASGQRGQLRRYSSAKLAATKTNPVDKNYCLKSLKTDPIFPFNGRGQPLPVCRRGIRGTVDIGLAGVGPSTKGAERRAFNPSPRCGMYRIKVKGQKACYPTAYNKGNARKQHPVIGISIPGPGDPSPNGPLHPETLVPFYDSFGPPGMHPRSAAKPFGYVEQGPYPGCFNMYDADQNFIGSTDPLDSPPGGPKSKCQAANAGRAQATIQYQGQGCMATREMSQNYIIASVINNGKADARNVGIRGYIPLGAVPVSPRVDAQQDPNDPSKGTIRQFYQRQNPDVRISDVEPRVPGGLMPAEFLALQKAYPGCGPRKLGAKLSTQLPLTDPVDNELHAADNFVRFPAASSSFPYLDQYLNKTTLDKNCDDTSLAPSIRSVECSGFYANNQGPCNGPDVAIVLISSNYVSNSGAPGFQNPSKAAAGGVTRGIVRRDQGAGSFRPLDKMGYFDNNIPSDQPAKAMYVFGDFNPGATARRAQQRANSPSISNDELDQNMYGWTAIRRPQAPPATYTPCP